MPPCIIIPSCWASTAADSRASRITRVSCIATICSGSQAEPRGVRCFLKQPVRQSKQQMPTRCCYAARIACHPHEMTRRYRARVKCTCEICASFRYDDGKQNTLFTNFNRYDSQCLAFKSTAPARTAKTLVNVFHGCYSSPTSPQLLQKVRNFRKHKH
jgi:hypothetical protein